MVSKKELANFFSIKISSEPGDSSARKDVCSESGFKIFSEFDHQILSAHFHDTRAMALANVCAAISEGIRKFDSCIGGLGGCPFAPGAAGNLATEDLANIYVTAVEGRLP